MKLVEQYADLVRDCVEMLVPSAGQVDIRVSQFGLSAWNVMVQAWPETGDYRYVAGPKDGHTVAFKTLAKQQSERGDQINIQVVERRDMVKLVPRTVSPRWDDQEMRSIYQRIFDMLLKESPRIVLTEDGTRVVLDVIYGHEESPDTIRWVRGRIETLVRSLAHVRGKELSMALIDRSTLPIA